jgi:RND superfamily putative drug exporter
LIVGIWILAVVVLGIQGRAVEQELNLHPYFIDGTQTKRAHEIALREFGSDYSMIVMLRGPRGQVDRQGRSLADRLDAMPRVLVASPWSGGPGAVVDGLSPRPGVAALLVRSASSEGDTVSGLLPSLQQQVDEHVASPVQASIAGLPVVIESLRSGSEQSSSTGELIALPVLLLVLLLVFRSVFAAMMPLVVGGAVVVACRGMLSLFIGVFQFDVLAVGVTGMMGLALGVDYSLLAVSRFREERKRADLTTAVDSTVRATIRSVVPAGSALLLAMLVAPVVIPGSPVRSIAVAIAFATVMSMLSAICVVPALLMLFGDKLDRWALPRRNGSRATPLLWLRRLAMRPAVVTAIVFGLLLFAGLAFRLDTGVGGTALLPAGDTGRQQIEEVEHSLGSGWAAPMEVIVNGRGHPVTSLQRLRAISAFQRHVEGDPGVASMAGLARINHAAGKLAGIEGDLADQERGLDRLESGISRLGDGAARGTGGLLSAARGARGLSTGLGAANAGAGALAGALQKTAAGSGRLSQGLGRADEGSDQLAQGTTKVSTGAGRLAEALGKAREKSSESQGSARLLKNAMRSGDDRLGELHEPLRATEEQLAAASRALRQMTTGKDDAEYVAALAAVEQASRHLTGTDPQTGEPVDPTFRGVDAGVRGAEGQFGVGLYLATGQERNERKASKGLGKLSQGAERLDQGLRRLAAGSQRVSNGIAALSKGGEQLSPALQRLSQGADRLSGGLGLLETGSGRLADGLGEGAERSKLLPQALRRIGRGLEARRGSGSQLDQIRQRSPGLFRSAYFVLASLDGAPPRQRAQLGSLLNVDRGGIDARLLVIPRDDPTSEKARETVARLKADAAVLARQTGTEVVVGGVAPADIDIDTSLRSQAPWMRVVLSLVTLLVLIPLLRSLTIPILAALINLITVSASFGVLSLLFNDSLLGGPGYVDTTVLPAAILVMFALAIDYEVFVFARIREEYVRTGSTSAALSGGLDRTAHVVTGAAIIMMTIFLAFSASGLVTIRNFGIAQSVAVFIDAFIVRLILVPAMIGWLGRWSWWMPAWLDRLLPGGGPVAAGADRGE